MDIWEYWAQRGVSFEKPVAILGYGISGKACAHLLDSLKIHYVVLDQKEGALPKDLRVFSLAIYSPGFAPYHPWLKAFYRAKVKCINELDFSAASLPNSIVAVTGTNGKTSITECLCQLFQQLGRKTLSVGNNGQPLSEVLARETLSKDTWLIYEVSSFQAWGLRHFKPQQVIWTNFAPDHLNYHRSLSHYYRSKAHLVDLCLKQKGQVFMGPTLKRTVSLQIKKTIYYVPVLNEEDLAWTRSFAIGVSAGQQENIQILKVFCQQNGISKQALTHCLQTFTPPEHRLHLTEKVGNLIFWEDSKATNLHALQSALASFKKAPCLYWILGGQSKGESLQAYVQTFRAYPNVQRIYFIGQTGPLLYDLFKKSPLMHVECILSRTLDAIFSHLKKTETATVIFSPGFASWDQFPNYAERGKAFTSIIKNFKS